MSGKKIDNNDDFDLIDFDFKDIEDKINDEIEKSTQKGTDVTVVPMAEQAATENKTASDETTKSENVPLMANKDKEDSIVNQENIEKDKDEPVKKDDLNQKEEPLMEIAEPSFDDENKPESEETLPVIDEAIDEAVGEELANAPQDEESQNILPIFGGENEEDIDGVKKRKRKKTASDYVRYFMMAVAVCVLIYAGYQLTMIFMEYKAGEDEYAALENYVSDDKTDYIEDYDDGEPLNPNFTPREVDWQGLVSINSDIYAWIEFENPDIGIDYPVAKGSDNSYYLTHTVNGTENSSGSIFFDCSNSSDLSDMNTFIYGHNMKNGSMFGNLRHYKNADYYSGNEYFWVYTPEGRYRYKIFSCYEPLSDSDVYKWWSNPCSEYSEYLKTAKASSKYDTGVNVADSDKIVSLSTCTSRGDSYRFVIHAKLVHSEYK